MSFSIFDRIHTKTQSNAASPAEENNCYQWMFTLTWQGIQRDPTSYSIKFNFKGNLQWKTHTDSTTVWSLIKAGQINKGFSAEACKAQGQLQSGSDKGSSPWVCVCVRACVSIGEWDTAVWLQKYTLSDTELRSVLSFKAHVDLILRLHSVTKCTWWCFGYLFFFDMWLWFT